MTLPEGTIRIKEQSKYQKKGKKWVYIGYVPKPEPVFPPVILSSNMK